MAHHQRPVAQVQFMREFLRLKGDQFALIAQKSVGFVPAGAGQGQRNSCGFNTRTNAFRAAFGLCRSL